MSIIVHLFSYVLFNFFWLDSKETVKFQRSKHKTRLRKIDNSPSELPVFVVVIITYLHPLTSQAGVNENKISLLTAHIITHQIVNDQNIWIIQIGDV